MRINFRHGVVAHQPGVFLQLNNAGHVNLLALNKSVMVTVAHQYTNYLHSEDNTVESAWTGPFSPSEDYWLYWEFDKITFGRTFGKTTLQPVAQSRPPGHGDVDIIASTGAQSPNGSFTVAGEFVWTPDRQFAVVGSAGNDGNYTVREAIYNWNTGRTTIFVNEDVAASSASGAATLDIDSKGDPLRTIGRMWYDTVNFKQYVWTGANWSEVLRVLACRLRNANTFMSASNRPISGTFAGSQIGNTQSVFAGRVLYSQQGSVIRRTDGTLFTTEDEFFTNQSRVDGLRLESNVAAAKTLVSSIAQYQPVAWEQDGTIRAAQYDDTGETIVGVLTENLQYNGVGGVILQGTVTNVDWDWTDTGIGRPLWILSGDFVDYDPHVQSSSTYPTKRNPVARVLSSNSIIFDQGIGGGNVVTGGGTGGDGGPVDASDVTGLDEYLTTWFEGVGGVTIPGNNDGEYYVMQNGEWVIMPEVSGPAPDPVGFSVGISDVDYTYDFPTIDDVFSFISTAQHGMVAGTEIYIDLNKFMLPSMEHTLEGTAALEDASYVITMGGDNASILRSVDATTNTIDLLFDNAGSFTARAGLLAGLNLTITGSSVIVASSDETGSLNSPSRRLFVTGGAEFSVQDDAAYAYVDVSTGTLAVTGDLQINGPWFIRNTSSVAVSGTFIQKSPPGPGVTISGESTVVIDRMAPDPTYSSNVNTVGLSTLTINTLDRGDANIELTASSGGIVTVNVLLAGSGFLDTVPVPNVVDDNYGGAVIWLPAET